MDRIPYLSPPSYDIDSILKEGWSERGQALGVLDTLWSAIEKVPESGDGEYYRPDSALLEPEVVVRDICRFISQTNSGFGAAFGYSGSIPFFFRALRAVRIVTHPEALRILESVRATLVSLGISEPTTYPDDPSYGDYGVDWDEELEDKPDFEQDLEAATSELDDQWWEIRGASLAQSVCEYLSAQREALRTRKQ